MVAIVLAGYYVEQTLASRQSSQIDAFLLSIGQHKANDIQSWYDERMGDATILKEDMLLISHVPDYLDNNLSDIELENIHSRLRVIREVYKYHSIQIVNRSGEVLLSAGDIVPLGTFGVQTVARSLDEDRIIMTDLHKHILSGKEEIGIDIAVPLNNRPDDECCAVYCACCFHPARARVFVSW